MSDNRRNYQERELRNIGAFVAGFALVALLFLTRCGGTVT